MELGGGSQQADLAVPQTWECGRPAGGERAADLQQQVWQLEEALRTNRTIGMAIGLLMAQWHEDRQAAWARLVRLSQHSNTKVALVAEQLVVDAEPTPDGRLR